MTKDEDMSTAGTPELAIVISLQEARNRYRPGKCQHMRMTVDDDLYEVTCDECGARLNPVTVLMRFATQETRWAREHAKLREVLSKLDARTRCKCDHCGRFTRIHV